MPAELLDPSDQNTSVYLLGGIYCIEDRINPSDNQAQVRNS